MQVDHPRESQARQDPTGPLLTAWEQAFTAPTSWRESLAAGMDAMIELLEADRNVAKTCVLAQLPVSTGGPLVWHRELVRGRIVDVMHRQWDRCGGPPVPSVHFEVFLGEACTLLRDRAAKGTSYADLTGLVVALWGGESDRRASADVEVGVSGDGLQHSPARKRPSGHSRPAAR